MSSIDYACSIYFQLLCFTEQVLSLREGSTGIAGCHVGLLHDVSKITLSFSEILPVRRILSELNPKRRMDNHFILYGVVSLSEVVIYMVCIFVGRLVLF